MRVKILKKFPSPINNRMAIVNQEMTVSKSIFWLRRLNDKDCVQISLKAKTAKLQVEKKKGSK